MDGWKGGGQTDRYTNMCMCVHPWPLWQVPGCVVRGLAVRHHPHPGPWAPRSAAVRKVVRPRAALVRVPVELSCAGIRHRNCSFWALCWGSEESQPAPAVASPGGDVGFPESARSTRAAGAGRG